MQTQTRKLTPEQRLLAIREIVEAIPGQPDAGVMEAIKALTQFEGSQMSPIRFGLRSISPQKPPPQPTQPTTPWEVPYDPPDHDVAF